MKDSHLKLIHSCGRNGLYFAAGTFIVVAASMHIRFWLLELVASYTLLITALAMFVLLFSVAAARHHNRGFRKDIHRKKFAIPAAISSVLFLYVLFVVGSSATYQRCDYSLAANLKVASYNKLLTAKDLENSTKYFLEQKIDIILAQEISEQEVAHYSKELSLPHTYTTDNNNSAGSTEIAIISRYPLKNIEDLFTFNNSKRISKAEVTVAGKDVAVYVAHVTVPISPKYYAQGNQELKQVAQILKDQELPVIFGGDFNTSAFSPTLREFNKEVKENNIRTTSQGAIPSCSWYGLGPVFCSRIDHIYISDSIKLGKTYIAPDTGSDHRAVVVELQL